MFAGLLRRVLRPVRQPRQTSNLDHYFTSSHRGKYHILISLVRKRALASCGLRSFKRACAATHQGQRYGSMKLSLVPYNKSANSKGSGETSRMRRNA